MGFAMIAGFVVAALVGLLVGLLVVDCQAQILLGAD